MVEAALKNRRPLGVFVSSLLILLILMSYQVTDQATGRTVLGNVLFQIFSPVQAVVMWSVRGIGGGLSRYLGVVHANEENAALKSELAQLKIQLSATAQQQEENDRLRAILHLQQRLAYQMVIGEVIGRDARSVSSTLTINRGQRSRIRMDMAAVTPEGVVGKTIEVAPFTSRVQLITDAASAIGVMLERTQIAGILAGTGDQRCMLRYLPVISDVKVGDIVVTSGQDGVFPQGLPVGRIQQLVRESDLYKSAEVLPYREFSSIREIVFLVQPITPPAVTEK